MNRSGLSGTAAPALLPRRSPPRIIRRNDKEWPDRLNELGPHQPPELLHACGRLMDPSQLHIAIVGPRRPSAAGIEVARQLATGAVEAGCVIVSGLAIGIDSAAHRAALDAGGSTVAVIGCGLDIDYPMRNRPLRERIEQDGTVVSEYPEGTPPLAFHFPERNRIVAGLASAVIVVEGTMKSGALITARLALDANRLVFAVPGSFRNPLAEGPNELIRTCQAGLVTKVDHIFEELAPNLVWRDRVDRLAPRAPDLEPKEEAILLALDDHAVSPDQLAGLVHMLPGEIALAIARLEVRGFVLQKGPGYEISEPGARARAAVLSSKEHPLFGETEGP
jgi:DNA processing protein